MDLNNNIRSHSRRHTAGMRKEKLLRDATNGVCAICGQPIENIHSNYITVDHIFPVYIVKWLDDADAVARILPIFKDIRNLTITHKTCNENKNVTIDRLSELHLTGEWRQFVEKNLPIIKPYAEIVDDMAKGVRQAQNNKCYICGRGLFSSSNMRRLDSSLPRTVANAICVCKDCNSFRVHREKKRKVLYYGRKHYYKRG